MKKYLILLFALFALTACDARLSTKDLASEVKKSMDESMSDANISVVSLIITRDSEESNGYSGMLQTKEPNGFFSYDVVITYDGENMTWRILD